MTSPSSNGATFGTGYADAYDTLYQTKDYDRECAALETIFRRYATGPMDSILDLGCGTGNHAVRLAERGYHVVGVDRSAGMLDAARAKATGLIETGSVSFIQSDLRDLELERTFDVVVLLFAVMGYQTDNSAALAALKTARRHLRPGGLLVFDVWYGAAVLTQRPGERVKQVTTDNGFILRVASGELDSGRQLCTVHYDLLHVSDDQITGRTQEAHVMRYFFPNELDLLLRATDFQTLRISDFNDISRDPSEDTWNIWVVAAAGGRELVGAALSSDNQSAGTFLSTVPQALPPLSPGLAKVRRNILLVHIEGNINNNANLSGIVEILCERGHHVDVLLHRRSNIFQAPPHPDARMLFIEPNTQQIALRPPYDLVIGVDCDGIRLGARVAHQLGVPLGLISYEIFFENEIEATSKQLEIDACRNVRFAVVQDALRGELLCSQNHVPRGRIILLPVGGRGARAGQRQFLLNERLGIPRDKKIAILAGSITSWSMADRLIKSAMSWPDNWVLVLHGRYGVTELSRELFEFVERNNSRGNIFLSSVPANTPGEFSQLMHSVDLGLAFYQPNYGNRYEGNNLKYIGMASGKIAAYLQHGIPVICNEIGVIAEEIQRHNLGRVVRSPEDVGALLEMVDFGEARENCLMYFDQTLNLDRTIQPVLDEIERTW